MLKKKQPETTTPGRKQGKKEKSIFDQFLKKDDLSSNQKKMRTSIEYFGFTIQNFLLEIIPLQKISDQVIRFLIIQEINNS